MLGVPGARVLAWARRARERRARERRAPARQKVKGPSWCLAFPARAYSPGSAEPGSAEPQLGKSERAKLGLGVPGARVLAWARRARERRARERRARERRAPARQKVRGPSWGLAFPARAYSPGSAEPGSAEPGSAEPELGKSERAKLVLSVRGAGRLPVAALLCGRAKASGIPRLRGLAPRQRARGGDNLVENARRGDHPGHAGARVSPGPDQVQPLHLFAQVMWSKPRALEQVRF